MIHKRIIPKLAMETRLFPNVTKVEISQEEHRKSFVSAWKTRKKNLKFFFRKFETAARPNTGPEIWSKNPSSKFFKKKLFFLAMFKNEITTFKKKNFEKFRFFFAKNFRKSVTKFFWDLFFQWFFFSVRPVFCDGSRDNCLKIETWPKTLKTNCQHHVYGLLDPKM